MTKTNRSKLYFKNLGIKIRNSDPEIEKLERENEIIESYEKAYKALEKALKKCKERS
jgi:ribosome-associated translation inhibitor RaiA